MCYSAEVYVEYEQYRERFQDVAMDIKAYAKTFWWDRGLNPLANKAPRALFRELRKIGPPDLRENLEEAELELIGALQQEIAEQKERVRTAEAKLLKKETKAARENIRIGTKNVAKAERKLADLRRTEFKGSDYRVFPGVYVPVMIVEDGRKILRPMRYQCRVPGSPSFFDQKFPGTYNARRDNLEGFWKKVFGYYHGLIVATKFYEHVRDAEDNNVTLEFTPSTGEVMLIPCLYAHWTDPKGVEPDLWSFAAITDDPLPEVAAAGHDRTVLDIKPEHVEQWLNPDPKNLAALYDIFDDRARPFYEHKEAP